MQRTILHILLFLITSNALGMNNDDNIFFYKNGFLIRTYEPNQDFDAVCTIARQNIKSLVRFENYAMNPEKALREQIIPALEKSKTLVCLQGNELIGYINYCFYHPKWSCNQYLRTHINHIVVDQMHQRCGAGSLLMQEVISQSIRKNVTTIELTTVNWSPLNKSFIEENHIASLKKFYLKFGFTIAQDGNGMARRYGIYSDRVWEKKLRKEPGLFEQLSCCLSREE